MSAVNIAISSRGDRAFVLSDTASYIDSVFIGPVCKTFAFPHANAVFAFRGTVILGHECAQLIQRHASYDEMAANLQADMQNGQRNGRHRLGGYARYLFTPRKLEGFIVGWSDNAGRMQILTANYTDGFLPMGHETIMAPPVLPAMMVDLCMPTPTDEHGVSTSPWPKALLRIMEAQRSLKRANAEPIGGSAVLTEIGRRGIFQSVLHEWPDKVGERIAA